MPRKIKLAIDPEIPLIDPRYKVIRDTREKVGQGWLFEENQHCAGTVIQTMKTGDYTLEGLEKVFVIERKQSLTEFAKNIFEERFEKELIRLEGFAFPFIFLEFSMTDIMNWPYGSGLPKHIQNTIKISKHLILKRFMDFQVKYRTKIILVGRYGKENAASLFKRIIEHENRKSE